MICSGGIRNGIEVAKAIALGADAAALALPFLKAAEKSVDDAVLAIQQVIRNSEPSFLSREWARSQIFVKTEALFCEKPSIRPLKGGVPL